jgi:hypothetical protein
MKQVILLRFEWSVRALAQPAHVQLGLYPDFVCVGDELVLEFDEWRQKFLDSPVASNWSEGRVRMIDEIDQQIVRMTDQHDEDLWLDRRALAERGEWGRLRELAERLIQEMNWSDDPPPPERDLFVGPPE